MDSVLRKSEAIRIEHRGKNKEYVFLCSNGCGREIRRRPDRLKIGSPGYCHTCGNERNWSKKCKPFESLYHRVKRAAESRNLFFQLTLEEFVSFTSIKSCEYCGDLVTWIPRKSFRGGSHPSNLDRKDNKLGYSKENCVVCCGECNRIKGSKYSYEQMKAIGKCLVILRKTGII